MERADINSAAASNNLKRSAIVLGIALASIWGIHAALASLPGRAYLFATRLNDSTAAVSPNILLHPAFLGALALLLLRGTPLWRRTTPGGKCGLAAALSCWALSATMSTVAHYDTDQVLLTYFSVFLAGGLVYAALDGVALDGLAFEIALVGLLVGALFPLLGGISAFAQEWGSLDLDTVLGAYRNVLRMDVYEAATFGSRGNTASFVIILLPLFLWVALDRSRTRAIRIASAGMLVPLFANLLILEIRAAFLSVFFSLAMVFGFRLGVKRYPLFLAGVAVSLLFLGAYLPDVMDTMSDRLRPVVTIDTTEDVSVSERADAINEGWTLGQKHWLLGIGPGGGITLHSQGSAHQFNVQQFMESGIPGLLGSLMFSGTVLLLMFRTITRGQDGGTNNLRFALLVGPSSFVVYGIFSNPTLGLGYVNTWAVLVSSMLALVPSFEPRRGERAASRDAVAALPAPVLAA